MSSTVNSAPKAGSSDGRDTPARSVTTSLSASSLQPASRGDLLGLEGNGKSAAVVMTVSQHLIDERHIWIADFVVFFVCSKLSLKSPPQSELWMFF